MSTMIRAWLVALVIIVAAFNVPAFAQVNADLGAIITNALRTPGTVTSNQQTNTDGVGLICVFTMTASSGGPSSTFKIQGFDAASASYYDLATSGAITALNTPTALITKSGAISADAIAPNVVKSVPVPLKWRISQTITGAGTAVTGTIGCNKLK